MPIQWDGNKRIEILMVPVNEHIKGSYRMYMRIIYKVVSSGVVNNVLWVFRKRNINDKMPTIFVNPYEGKDSMGLTVRCLELQRGQVN